MVSGEQVASDLFQTYLFSPSIHEVRHATHARVLPLHIFRDQDCSCRRRCLFSFQHRLVHPIMDTPTVISTRNPVKLKKCIIMQTRNSIFPVSLKPSVFLRWSKVIGHRLNTLLVVSAPRLVNLKSRAGRSVMQTGGLILTMPFEPTFMFPRRSNVSGQVHSNIWKFLSKSRQDNSMVIVTNAAWIWWGVFVTTLCKWSSKHLWICQGLSHVRCSAETGANPSANPTLLRRSSVAQLSSSRCIVCGSFRLTYNQ